MYLKIHESLPTYFFHAAFPFFPQSKKAAAGKGKSGSASGEPSGKGKGKGKGAKKWTPDISPM